MLRTSFHLICAVVYCVISCFNICSSDVNRPKLVFKFSMTFSFSGQCSCKEHPYRSFRFNVIFFSEPTQNTLQTKVHVSLKAGDFYSVSKSLHSFAKRRHRKRSTPFRLPKPPPYHEACILGARHSSRASLIL